MTTIQPRLVRADTLDLQTHDAPSAKDHTRSPTFTPYSHGSNGPHHMEALRHAEESAYNDRKSSPRVSAEDSNHPSINNQSHQYDSMDEDDEGEGDDDEDEQQHGAHGTGYGDEDQEGNDENDDDLDDDLLDKISSSPSIEDGNYPPFIWPLRVGPVGDGPTLVPMSKPTRGSFLSTPSPLSGDFFMDSKSSGCRASHHLSKENWKEEWKVHLGMATYEDNREQNTRFSILSSTQSSGSLSGSFPGLTRADDIRQFLIPVDDHLLHSDLMDETDHESDHNWLDEGNPWYQDESSSDDDSDDFQFTNDPRYIDSGWGGECLRETEDIDFEFVYALHTFVATVEGQANATKGDTMVLLDDSNSYWWLVRVVKDGSIGYLPAEHIETPTERLARLNKHRNIDLSASMLGDNPEKSKNPLKKAMRRRNAKTVAFTAPTYYEPSEYEYDTDEEEEGDEQMLEDGISTQDQNASQSEDGAVQDGQVTTDTHDTITIVNGVKRVASDDHLTTDSPTSPIKADTADSGSALSPTEESFQRSRNGVVRNTDSFFKDNTAETKKISLTPRLLRGDSESANASDQDLRSKSSADTFDKMLGTDDKSKEKDKEKKKDKKGMLSGLFKRKDKGSKTVKGEAEEDKVADDAAARTTQSKETQDTTLGIQPQEKKPSKLQKHQPNSQSPKNSPTEVKAMSSQLSAPTSPTHSPKPSEAGKPVIDPGKTQAEPDMAAGEATPSEQTSRRVQPHSDKRSIFAPITTVLKSTTSGSGDHDPTVKPVYSKRAKERFAIDVSDSDDDDETPTMSHTSQEQRAISPIRDSQLHDPRPDSAMEVSPVEPSDNEFDDDVQARDSQQAGEHAPVASDVHGSPRSDTVSTSKPSPSLATHTPSTSRSTPTWSDASLRSYMESDQDIRDLLIIVHDKSNVTPVGLDHPLMGGLFTAERTRLAELQTQLDSMLTTWIARKNPGVLSR